jgi:outer membrane protein assembly factor BamB
MQSPISHNTSFVSFVPSWLKTLLCASAPLREIRLFLSIAILLCIARTDFAANWDRFRGPNGAGQSDDAGIPTKWELANFLWKRPLSNVGHSSPVIWDKRLFLTSGDPKTGAQIINAFDAQSGAPLWEKRFETGSYHMNGLNSYASSTPAVDAEHVYLLWLQEGRVILTALTHNGNEVWHRDVGSFEETHGFGKSPVVIDDLVYVANDSLAESTVVALDRKNGDVRWHIPRESGITAFATPCLFDPAAKEKLLLTVSTASGLTALNAKTGKIAWQGLKDSLTQRCVSSPIVAGGMVLASSGQGGVGKSLIAARPEGKGLKEIYRLEQSIPQVPTPIVASDLLFLWQDRGIVSCYDLETGKQNYRERVGGDYHSSPIRVGNRIFGVARNGEVVVLAADRKFEVLARNALNEACHATPAVANGRLYLRTEASLVCVGEPPTAKN